MRGIELFIDDSFNSNVLSLLTFIDIENYNWHIPEEEVLHFKNGRYYDDPIIHNSILSGLELKRIIEEKSYSIIHINLRAFPIGINLTEPEDYFDYIKSDCFLVFLCHDYRIVEIYCKDISIIKRIYEKYNNSSEIMSIEFITDENDGRTGFYLMK